MRIPTGAQNLDAQLDALNGARVERIFSGTAISQWSPSMTACSLAEDIDVITPARRPQALQMPGSRAGHGARGSKPSAREGGGRREGGQAFG